MNSNIEHWYSMKEICEYLSVSCDTVLAWIEKRNIPAARIGRLWKCKISEVNARGQSEAYGFADNRKESSPSAPYITLKNI